MAECSRRYGALTDGGGALTVPSPVPEVEGPALALLGAQPSEICFQQRVTAPVRVALDTQTARKLGFCFLYCEVETCHRSPACSLPGIFRTAGRNFGARLLAWWSSVADRLLSQAAPVSDPACGHADTAGAARGGPLSVATRPSERNVMIDKGALPSPLLPCWSMRKGRGLPRRGGLHNGRDLPWKEGSHSGRGSPKRQG